MLPGDPRTSFPDDARPDMLDLAIQIVNFRTRRYLPACLDSVIADLSGSGLRSGISVLDNASGDDLGDLQELYADVAFRRSDTNRGFGAGHNLLAREVRARHLLILNPDIAFKEPRTIVRLLETLLREPGAKVAGPKLYDPGGKPQRWDHARLRPSFRPPESAGDRVEAAWVSGAVFLIDKGLFDELRGFDENIFLYAEEMELCLRIRKQGHRVVYDPTIGVMHVGQVSGRRKDHIYTSYDYILDKHYRNTLLYYPLKALNALLRRTVKPMASGRAPGPPAA
jgi:GT2 family glycosyltransferase